MIKQKKNLLGNIYWSFLVIGTILLGVYAVATKLEVRTILQYALYWALLLIVVAILVFFVPFGKAGKKLDALMPILVDEQDPDRYIKELTAVLETTASPMAFQLGLVNLASAYCDKRNYNRSMEVLNQVQISSLSIANKSVYWAIKALTLFYLGKDEEAIAIMDREGKRITQDYRLKNLGATPSILAVFYQLAKNNKKEAREIYAQARLKWYSPRYAADFDYLDRELSKKSRKK